MNRCTVEKKKCEICVGCGRCGNTASGLHVITESFLKTKLLSGVNAADKGFFAFADLGTTTIAMELYDEKGQKLAQHVCPNPQRYFGADVISRIQAAENPINAGQMRMQVILAVKEGLKCFSDKGYEVSRLYIAGNTTMLYLLCGHDTQPLGYAPFYAAYLQSEELMLGEVPAVTLPGLSAFVGADIVAGILACGMQEREKISLLIDLGTNGEMVLGNREKLLACSTAAGPAFEGVLQAEGQAVWGADVIAFTAELLKQGILDETGLLREPYFTEGVQIGGLRMTQEHIRSLQTAKAAIAAGIQVLVQEYGLEDVTAIDKVYLAGGFGFYLKEEAAVEIGLLPKELAGKVQAVGNSALAGMYRYHFEGQGKGNLEKIQNCAKVINLAEVEAFTSGFVENMYLKLANFL